MSQNTGPEWDRTIQAGLFHGRLLRDQPFACGPFPEPMMQQLAEAAARMINVGPILNSDATPEVKKQAVEISLAAMWAAGFKTVAQALGPVDTPEGS